METKLQSLISKAFKDLFNCEVVIYDGFTYQAAKENKSNITSMCDLLFGIVDVCSFMLILLPLYPNTVDEFVYSVNLLAYAETTSFNRVIYWVLFVSLIMVGVVKILLTKLEIKKSHKKCAII